MKVYKCDSCGKIIENPYEEKMKEFYVGITSDFYPIYHSSTVTHKVKVHLCKDCFYGLHKIAKNKIKEEDNI